MKNYYEIMKDLREDRDLLQKELAEALDLTNQSAYQRYEAGKVQMPLTLLIKVAKFYNVSTDYILGLTNDKRKFW